ncbi:unnamed protein product [Effrenium voratum]|uniref:Uncharacterized protein n=1 Tax=Effrenium voratum TaxID=2562239 RepID=A0AA36JS75_9DINO|nr:unnamed protein product [Effrenium voratum]
MSGSLSSSAFSAFAWLWQLFARPQVQERLKADKALEENALLVAENRHLEQRCRVLEENALLVAQNRRLEQRCRELEEDLRFYSDWWRAKAIRISSPLTRCEEVIWEPAREGFAWKWYPTSCPCCRRPLDVTVTTHDDVHPWDDWDTRTGCGNCARQSLTLALCAQKTERSSQELQAESGHRADLVLMHTDDVPQNYLDELGKTWSLRRVDYIDGVPGLYSSKGTRFDGVFTKLCAWQLVEYDKVLLMDIDTFPLQSLHELFDLDPPAAFIRGNSDLAHGEEVDGRSFFLAEWDERSWGQAGGINAGVILLRPDELVYQQMLSEVTSEGHPSHIAGNGPEQDYLTRFFAANLKHPWRHVDVSYNFQLHHVPFAMEKLLAFRSRSGEDGVSDSWLPRRLAITAEDIKLVHFSGELKYWHLLLNADLDTENASFAEKMMSEFASYGVWVSGTEDATPFGVERSEGRLRLTATKADVTDLVERSFQHVRRIATSSITGWRCCAERLLTRQPGLLHAVKHPTVPAGCFAIGAPVAVQWPWEGGNELQAQVVGVHEDGSYTVHYRDYDRDWLSCTERQVPKVRVSA